MRTTLDADFAQALPVLEVPALPRAAEPRFQLHEAEVRAAASANSRSVTTHRQDLVQVDAHVVSDVGHARAEFERARWIQIGDDRGEDVLVTSAEDVVPQELVSYARAGEVSDRRLRDLSGILRARGRSPDRGCMRGWAQAQGTWGLRERPWREAGGSASGSSG